MLLIVIGRMDASTTLYNRREVLDVLQYCFVIKLAVLELSVLKLT